MEQNENEGEKKEKKGRLKHRSNGITVKGKHGMLCVSGPDANLLTMVLNDC